MIYIYIERERYHCFMFPLHNNSYLTGSGYNWDWSMKRKVPRYFLFCGHFDEFGLEVLKDERRICC